MTGKIDKLVSGKIKENDLLEDENDENKDSED
jgi:hypothetical protein